MKLSHFSCEVEVSSYLTGISRNLNLYSLLNILQDVSSKHSALLSFDYESMKNKGGFWVLSRQRLSISYWPQLREKLLVKTWIRSGHSARSIRDFKFYIDHTEIGMCSTTWVTLSNETRKPIIIDRSDILSELEFIDPLPFSAEKIVPVSNWPEVSKFKVLNSHIDQNLHVNNTRYSQWVLDSLPFEEYVNFKIFDYEINFLSETLINDEISLQRDNLTFRGVRISDNKTAFIVRFNHF